MTTAMTTARNESTAMNMTTTQPTVKNAIIAALFFMLLTLSGCSRPDRIETLNGMTMGTTYSVKVVYPKKADLPAIEKVREYIEQRLTNVNATFSTYLPDSELMRLNQMPVNKEVVASQDLAELLAFNKGLQKNTNGAFNMHISPLINLWGFGEKTVSTTASPEVIQAMVDTINQADLEVNLTEDGYTAKKKTPLHINLSATAKGWGVDAVASELKTLGFDNYLVEIGGEIRAHGEKAKNTPWVIAIEKPLVNERAYQQLLRINNISMATSGDYRNYYERDGKRLSHIINPKTGYPIDHTLVSVTVLHENCYVADGLATAMMVLGVDEAIKLSAEWRVPIYLISKTEDGFKTWNNPAMQRYFVK